MLCCSACVDRHAELRSAAQAMATDLGWREINVLESLDPAVGLDVVTLPSIVIDGELVLTAMPTVAQPEPAQPT